MISWIVATHDPTILKANLAASLLDMNGDELVVVENAPSIAAAYNEGRARAKGLIHCYVHHDVRILNPPGLREKLASAVNSDVGMVGVVGSRTPVWPWWEGQKLGSVHDTRMGLLDFGPGGPCAILDGLLLATIHRVEWDETYPGWHGYDHDMCAQMLERGKPNYCITDGHLVVHHNTEGPTDVAHINGWAAAQRRFLEKWGA